MAKFDAATAVEPMEFDFTKYGGGEGTIPEPTTGGVNDFFIGMRQLIKEARASSPDQLDEIDLEEMSGDEMAETLDSIDDQMAEATKFQDRSIALTAALCQDSPDADALHMLPLRVLREFSKWMMGEINPKSKEAEETPAAPPRRAPQDRRPASRGSRRGRG